MTTVTVKGQVTIPKIIRKKFGITPGTQISFMEKNNKVFLQPKKNSNPFEKWIGFLNENKTTDSIMKDLRGEL